MCSHRDSRSWGCWLQVRAIPGLCDLPAYALPLDHASSNKEWVGLHPPSSHHLVLQKEGSEWERRNRLLCSREILTSSFLEKVPFDLKLNRWVEFTGKDMLDWFSKELTQRHQESQLEAGFGDHLMLLKKTSQLTRAGKGRQRTGMGVGPLGLALSSFPSSLPQPCISSLVILELPVLCCFPFSNTLTFQSSRQLWAVIKTSFLH